MFRKRKARHWTARESRSRERSPQVEAVWRERWTGGTEEHSWAGAGAVREERLLKFFLFLLERQSFSLLYLRSVHSTNMYWLCASAKHGVRCQGRGRDSQRWGDVKRLEFSEKDSVDTCLSDRLGVVSTVWETWPPAFHARQQRSQEKTKDSGSSRKAEVTLAGGTGASNRKKYKGLRDGAEMGREEPKRQNARQG